MHKVIPILKKDVNSLEKAKKYFGTFMDVLNIHTIRSNNKSFCLFILQIFWYVLNTPLIWPYELAQVSCLVAIMLGTCYAEEAMKTLCLQYLRFSANHCVKYAIY